MIDEAAKIKAVSTFFDVGGKTKKVETFTKGSEPSQKIMDAFSPKEKYSYVYTFEVLYSPKTRVS